LIRFKLVKAHQKNKIKYPADTITAEVYATQILDSQLLDYFNKATSAGISPVVVEDGAPVHFKGLAGPIRALYPIINHTRPPSTPNLNVIENCWSWIKGKLRVKGRKATNLDQLWKQVETLWNELPQEIIDGWIDLMENRRLAVERADGMQTGW
jgi:RNAse (barnase) inhibitor barstar